MRMILAVISLTLVLSACGEKKEVKDTVFGSQVQMKDKARAVEDQLREGAEKNREALKASEQGASEDQRIEGY
jgi:cytochrome c-type biogenesis protein CcmH/NrfF